MSTEAEMQQELFDFAKSPEPPEQKPDKPDQSERAERAEASGGEPRPEPAPDPKPAPVPPPQPAPPPAAESIPSWRLREEAEARRVAEDRARQMELRMAEIQTHLRQQQQKAKPAPNWFEDPEAAMQAALERYMQPYREEQERYRQASSRDQAEFRHGAEAVALAEKVFMDAYQRGVLDPHDFQRVANAPNRFDACVSWYKRLYSLHVVGDDPEAWYQKRLEAQMADPAFQTAMLKRIQGDAASRPAVTQLPPSLSRSTAAASNGAGTLGDMSHDSLWAFASSK